MDYIQIIAIISVIMSGISFIIYPAILGRDKGEYTYGGWIGTAIETIMLVLMALRIFGKL